MYARAVRGNIEQAQFTGEAQASQAGVARDRSMVRSRSAWKASANTGLPVRRNLIHLTHHRFKTPVLAGHITYEQAKDPKGSMFNLIKPLSMV
jgi:hypothetical protein